MRQTGYAQDGTAVASKTPISYPQEMGLIEGATGMDSFSRALALGTPAIVVVLMIMFPALSFWILLLALILTGIALKAGLHNVPEPDRAIIYRFGQMHRLGPSGMVFLVPGVDEMLHEKVDMRPVSQEFVVMQISTGDGDAVYLNLELTWQLRSDIHYIDANMKQTFLRTTDQRKKMIEHTVSVVARNVLLNYTGAHLNRADIRENITEVLRSVVNELLMPYGMVLDTVFWKGSSQSDDYLKNKLAMKIAHERVEAIIKDVQMVRERLPDVSPSEFLAQQAYIDLLRRGITPPMLPGQMGNATIPGLPYMPPRPEKEKK